MSKKIIILNGSPRSKGNTAMLCDEFAKGAESAGHKVTNFNLSEMNIRPCIGCVKGGKDTDSPCVQKDDMDKIYPAYKEADILVLASPMYYWSVTAILKAAFDRLFAVAEANNYVNPPKDCIMLMAAEGNTDDNWKPVIDYYQSLLGFLGWTDRGMVLAGGVMHVGDIKGHPALAEAKQLGASIS